MARSILLLASAVLAMTLSSFTAAQGVTVASATQGGEPLCSLNPISYQTAKQTYPEAAFALSQLEQHSIAIWYSDRNGDYVATAKQLVSVCPESSRLSLVVYGLPNKDCEAGSSAVGSTVMNSDDYQKFLEALVQVVGERKALYVLEPDAVGLLAKEGGCGAEAGYEENLLLAIKLLSVNPNAEIYLDVGYWALQYSESTARVAQVVKELLAFGGVKGITLNTSNFRSSAEMSQLCTNFQEAMGTDALHCIVDTSRNRNGSPSTEWCNVRSAGIGHPPTSDTGFSNLDYFMWIKPPGESDGKCDTGSHNEDAMPGPDPALFFKESFKLLWNQGYFVKELGLPVIVDGQIIPTTPVVATPTPVAEVVPTPAPPVPTTPVTTEVEAIGSPSPASDPEPDTASPTMAPFSGDQEQYLDEVSLLGLVPETDATPIEPPCPPADTNSGSTLPTTPFPSRPAARPTPTDVESLVIAQQQQHEDTAGLDDRDNQAYSPEVQQQLEEIAFNTEALLRSIEGLGDVGGYDDIVGVLPTSEDFVVGEVPESVFFDDGMEDRRSYISDSSSSDVGSSSGSQMDVEVKKIAVALGLTDVSAREMIHEESSGSSSVNALSVEKLSSGSKSSSSETEASTSTGGGAGTNRTEVLATLAVLAVVGTLAVVMAVVLHTRQKAALMNARLSTPDTTIIHITPAGHSIA